MDCKIDNFSSAITRCVQSCTLCERGRAEVLDNGIYYTPQCPSTVMAAKIAMIKFQPNVVDLGRRVFWDKEHIFTSTLVKPSQIYMSCVIKCMGSADFNCPYFDLEMRWLKPKVVIFTDEKSTDYMKVSFTKQIVDSFCNGLKYKAIRAFDDKELTLVLKMVKMAEQNQEVHNRLYS